MSMMIRLIAIPFLMAACSSSPDYEISRTMHVSAERLAEIKSAPYVKLGQGGGPAARLAGLDDDPWPDGILFLENGPYLRELGFGRGQALVEIDGKGVQSIFKNRWKSMSIKRPQGFHRDHYKDLIRYLFDKDPGEEIILTMYLNVPSRENEIGNYEPEVEYWRIILDSSISD